MGLMIIQAFSTLHSLSALALNSRGIARTL